MWTSQKLVTPTTAQRTSQQQNNSRIIDQWRVPLNASNSTNCSPNSNAIPNEAPKRTRLTANLCFRSERMNGTYLRFFVHTACRPVSVCFSLVRTRVQITSHKWYPAEFSSVCTAEDMCGTHSCPFSADQTPDLCVTLILTVQSYARATNRVETGSNVASVQCDGSFVCWWAWRAQTHEQTQIGYKPQITTTLSWCAPNKCRGAVLLLFGGWLEARSRDNTCRKACALRDVYARA